MNRGASDAQLCAQDVATARIRRRFSVFPLEARVLCDMVASQRNRRSRRAVHSDDEVWPGLPVVPAAGGAAEGMYFERQREGRPPQLSM